MTSFWDGVGFFAEVALLFLPVPLLVLYFAFSLWHYKEFKEREETQSQVPSPQEDREIRNAG